MEEKTYQNPHLDVQCGQLGSLEETLVFGVDPIVLTDVLVQTPNGQLFFFFTQPSGGSGEVGEDQRANRGHDDGHRALDDEEPAPRPQTLCVVEVLCDSGGDEAGECAREEGAGVQEGGPETEFFAGIPRAEEVETAGKLVEVSARVPGSGKGGQNLRRQLRRNRE